MNDAPMRPDGPVEDRWVVEVASGPNRGAVLALAPGRYTVGTAPHNDIVLADPAVAPGHFLLDVGTAGASVTALSAGAVLRRTARRVAVRTALGAGQCRALRPGAHLQVGQTRLRFSGGPSPLPGRGRVVAAACLVLLATSAAAGTYRAVTPAAAPPAPALVPAPAAAVLSPAEAATLFREHLDAAGLGAVALQVTDGAVLATGALPAADAPAWSTARQWFDGRFGSRVALVPSTTVAAAVAASAAPPLEIAAVGAVPVPYVISRSGERYMTGAVLPGGWTITGITPDRVTLRSGTREIGMSL